MDFKIKNGLYVINSIQFAVVIAILFGLMTFGKGLADWVPLIILIIYMLISTVMTISIKDESYLSVLFAVSMAVLCWTIWSLTLGRGNEHPWNGKIFLV
jgi:hypothetical protein